MLIQYSIVHYLYAIIVLFYKVFLHFIIKVKNIHQNWYFLLGSSIVHREQSTFLCSRALPTCPQLP